MEERIEKEKSELERGKLRENSWFKENELKHTDRFDVTKNVRFVAPFREKELDKLFSLFEKVATNLNWPVDKYTILLQSVLTGKASEAYTSMPLNESSDYYSVKEAMLKVYELVPETYRQNFRGLQKSHQTSHIEFSRDKQQHFTSWCR